MFLETYLNGTALRGSDNGSDPEKALVAHPIRAGCGLSGGPSLRGADAKLVLPYQAPASATGTWRFLSVTGSPPRGHFS
ncbi:hypothetical protein TREES_T100012284 [Tupaia chinensis]|uniref:Uncharacterized protein n=1 Tax=Tupaia chinensis TaxID=246437 RepID=L9JFA4_TUPCH|nr:hypothetical protein TREES_T100012284 [Tupaia chinensis]